MTFPNGGQRSENNPARSGTKDSFTGRYLGGAGTNYPKGSSSWSHAQIGTASGTVTLPFSHDSSAVKVAHGDSPNVTMKPHSDFPHTYEMNKAD